MPRKKKEAEVSTVVSSEEQYLDMVIENAQLKKRIIQLENGKVETPTGISEEKFSEVKAKLKQKELENGRLKKKVNEQQETIDELKNQEPAVQTVEVEKVVEKLIASPDSNNEEILRQSKVIERYREDTASLKDKVGKLNEQLHKKDAELVSYCKAKANLTRKLTDQEELIKKTRDQLTEVYSERDSAMEELSKIKLELEAIKKKKKVGRPPKITEKIVPKIVYVRADEKFFGEYNALLEEHANLLKENEIYRKINADLESKNVELTAMIDTYDGIELAHEDEIRMYENLLNEANNFALANAEENKELKRKNQILEGKAQSKQIMLNSYKDKNGISIIIQGDEQDLYPGEQKDIILSYIKDRMANLDKNTRQYHICDSLVKANPENGTRADIRRRVFEGLADITKVTRKSSTGMEDIGIRFTKEGKNHPKIVFKDRYSMAVSGTISDKSRAGSNCAAEFCKMCL